MTTIAQRHCAQGTTKDSAQDSMCRTELLKLNDKPECINLYDENGKETSLQDRIYRTDKISVAITTSFRPFYLVEKKMTEINLLGGLLGHERKNSGFQTGYSVYGADGISPTVLADGGGYGIMVAIEVIGRMDCSDGTLESANRVYSADGLCPTISTCGGGGQQQKVIEMKKLNYRIRKLTPKECWRLMGFSDEDFEKAAEVNSKTQLYKQAGNAIVKSCLMAIFSQLNIKGVKPWNDMTVKEQQELVNGKN